MQHFIEDYTSVFFILTTQATGLETASHLASAVGFFTYFNRFSRFLLVGSESTYHSAVSTCSRSSRSPSAILSSPTIIRLAVPRQWEVPEKFSSAFNFPSAPRWCLSLWYRKTRYFCTVSVERIHHVSTVCDGENPEMFPQSVIEGIQPRFHSLWKRESSHVFEVSDGENLAKFPQSVTDRIQQFFRSLWWKKSSHVSAVSDRKNWAMFPQSLIKRIQPCFRSLWQRESTHVLAVCDRENPATFTQSLTERIQPCFRSLW